MVKTRCFLFCILFLTSTVFGQFKYEISLKSFKGTNAKSAYSAVCKQIEFNDRRIKNGRLIFYSERSYTQSEMDDLVHLADYELDYFEVVLVTEETNISR